MKKLIILLILAALFFGCKTEASTTKTYTVTIDPNGGTLEQKTYTVEEGKTFTLSPEPSPTAAYYKVKDYINTADNSPFTMGTSAVNGDITLKVEWSVDLYVVRDMLTSGSGTWKAQGDINEDTTYTFKKTSDTSLAMKVDSSSVLLTLNFSDLDRILLDSDNIKYIAKFNSKLYPASYDFVTSLSDTMLILTASTVANGINEDGTKVQFVKQPQP